jgi:hypothetical protein
MHGKKEKSPYLAFILPKAIATISGAGFDGLAKLASAN